MKSIGSVTSCGDERKIEYQGPSAKGLKTLRLSGYLTAIAESGTGRSTARRALTGPRLPDPVEQVDGRTLRPRGISDDARALLEHVWASMGMPCGTYLGGEFINHDVAGWWQARDIAQTRSRPYQKNDQAHVESKNNHVVGKHAFSWRYGNRPGAGAAQPAVGVGVVAAELLHPDEEGHRPHHHRRRPQEADLGQTGHPVEAPAGIRSA
jgi:hypothetical protein